MGRPQARAYTFSRLMRLAMEGNRNRPAISARMVKPKTEYSIALPQTSLK